MPIEATQFKKGNQAGKRQPGEVVRPHPTIPGRDSRGHASGELAWTVHHRLVEIREVLTKSESPEKMLEVWHELRGLCLDRELGPHTQLKAMALYFDRLLGKPSQETTVHQSQQVTHKLDLEGMTPEKLAQLEAVLADQQPEIIIPELDDRRANRPEQT